MSTQQSSIAFTPECVEAAARRALEQNTGIDAPTSIHFVQGVEALLRELVASGHEMLAPLAAARSECVGKGDDVRIRMRRALKQQEAHAKLTRDLKDSAAEAEHDEALQTSEHNPPHPAPPLDDKDRALIGEGRRIRDFGRAQ